MGRVTPGCTAIAPFPPPRSRLSFRTRPSTRPHQYWAHTPLRSQTGPRVGVVAGSERGRRPAAQIGPRPRRRPRACAVRNGGRRRGGGCKKKGERVLIGCGGGPAR